MSISRIMILIVLLSILLPGYGQTTDSITVAGHLFNITEGLPHTLTINKCDISNMGAREICELGEDGTFVKKIPLSYPHTFTVSYNRHFINAFAAPGDSIFMDIDASVSPLSVNFSGDKAEINQQYDPAFRHLSSFFNSRSLPDDTVSIEKYLPVFRRNIEEGRDSVAAYAAKHNLTDEVISMLYTDNIYILASAATGYRGRNMEEKRAFFLDSIFDLFNEDNTKVMIFPYHLYAIMKSFPDVRENAPKGLVRDIMYACDDEAEVPERDIFYNQQYYDRLYTKTEPVKEISFDNLKSGSLTVYHNGELQELQDENPLIWLSSNFKGRPIYIDISATWCGPCRAGLAQSETLRKDFKGSDIVFAVIWTQSSKSDWLTLAPNFSNTTQIFIEDQDMMDRILGYLNVKGFPSYFMIDRKGNLLQEDIPGYRSPALPDFLKKHK